MSKHTPGPWKVHVRPSDGTVMVVSESSSLSVANVTDYGEMPAWENAQPIAASLDMLEVLESFPGFTDDATVGDAWIERKNAAIAKAKGGSTC